MNKNILTILAIAVLIPVALITLIKSPLLKENEASETSPSTAKVLSAKSSYELVEPPSKLSENQSGSNYITPDISSQTQHTEITISYTVKKGDSLPAIAAKYHADPQTIVDYPYNGFSDDLSLKVGQILIIPNGAIDSPVPSPKVAKGSGVLAWPIEGNVSQYASWWHPGAIDIAEEAGKPIKAADNGRVVKVEKLSTGYGWHVILDHQDGLTTLYAHMSEIKVEIGQIVAKGQVIGSVGTTGRSTGPHLHFEAKKNNGYVDPMTLLPTL